MYGFRFLKMENLKKVSILFTELTEKKEFKNEAKNALIFRFQTFSVSRRCESINNW